jgi:hypothetical protein
MEKAEKKLLSHFARLPPVERETLLAFAEFLAARSGADRPIEAPEPIPRPGSESVIGAVKRLSATYPMLDKSKVLHETSGLVTQHLMQGRAAVDVIDELEVVFRRHYEKLTREAE